LNVIDNVVIKLVNYEPRGEVIDSQVLRTIVYRCLLEYASKQDNYIEARRCVDRYAHSYGSADRQIEVEMVNGEIHQLDYGFLKKSVIPAIVQSVYPGIDYKVFIEQVSSKQLKRIENELLVAIKSLHIYRIKYHVLVSVATELALQPPHPWFAARPKVVEDVKGHLIKADKHYQKAGLDFP
jgi:hypothetical protein